MLNATSGFFVVFLATTTMLGDYIVFHERMSKLHHLRAFFDNATHAIIGAVSWAIVCLNKTNNLHTIQLLEIALCALISSLIDMDHFIEARSLNLRNATNLSSRPFLHCSTYPIAACLVLALMSCIFQWELWRRVALIILTAFLSHHTRDATRRGFWFHPWGSTPPINYYLSIIINSITPYLICKLYHTTIVHQRIKLGDNFIV